MEIKSFAECLAIAGNAKKHLMLGNGFSISLFPKIFNYKTLSENIESERMRDPFRSIGTYDFEFVMRRLLETLDIIQHYDIDGVISGHISNDIEELKQTLIHVISKAHPPKPSEITDRQYNSCREFLMNFDGGKIYTFNYDLLLYWVYMHFMDIPNQKLKCDDGFRHPYQDEYLPLRKETHHSIGR